MPTLLELLEAHKQNPKDKKTFGLVLQGGGMRAVYGGGAVATMVDNGLTGAFDHIIGSSAGALHGAYFLAMDQETLRSTYSEDLTNKNFVNFLRKEKKVDIDYMIDTVLKHKRPFDMKTFSKSKTKLHIVMTDAKSGHKVIVSKHRHLAEMYEEFRATAALPMLYDKPVLIGERWYIDGGVADNLPLDVAVKLGCTDIVVVMTQQVKNYHFDRRHDRLVKHLVRHFSKNQTAAVKRILPTNEHMMKFNLRLISRPAKRRRVYVLEPSDEEALISLASTDKPKVETLARLGVTDMEEFLHKEILVK